MGTIELKYDVREIKKKRGKNRVVWVYSKAELERFNPELLGLGNIGEKSSRTDVIAAVFDLSGFTGFCSQVDPHLSIPRFLKEFLDWLFKDIKYQVEERKIKEESVLYAILPFFAKFTGDGVMFLWNIENLNMLMICNIVIELSNICDNYSSEFNPEIKRHLSYVPEKLRCGVARGTVCSVGNREDYVGPCINIASRLQKLSNLRFCVSKRGIDFEEGMKKNTAQDYMVKHVSIRDIGQDELVIVRKSDFAELSEEDKALFESV